jgi:hypothetical protein
MDLIRQKLLGFKVGRSACCWGGQPDSTTTIQKADPWEGQQQYLKDIFSQAQNLYNTSGPAYYPGDMVVPFSPETQAAMSMQTQRAVNGSPIQQAANSQLVSTMNGDYLYGGPGFDAAFKAASNKILPAIDSQFEAAGRSNSGLADVAKTQALSDAFASQYEQERQNQLRSMLFAPSVANQDYTDISRLAEVGSQREAQQQQQLTADINRYNYNMNLPQAKLADYMSMIQGQYGGTTTTTTPLYQNNMAGILGGGMAGLSLLSSLGGMGGGAAAMGGGEMLGGGLLGLLGLF